MAINIFSSSLFGNDISFRWKSIEDSIFYRVTIQNYTNVILDRIINKKDLKSESDTFLTFSYPKDDFSIAPLIVHDVWISTINTAGVFTAQGQFILLEENVKDNFNSFKNEIDNLQRPDLITKINTFLNSALKSPQTIENKSSDNSETFLPGQLFLELSKDNLDIEPIKPVLFSFSGTGPTPPPPPPPPPPKWPR